MHVLLESLSQSDAHFPYYAGEPLIQCTAAPHLMQLCFKVGPYLEKQWIVTPALQQTFKISQTAQEGEGKNQKILQDHI